MIARLSKRIASFFVCNRIIQEEDKEVYEYGLQLLLSTVLNGLISLFLAIISGTFINCIFYLIAFVVIRKSAGGFHAETHWGCCCILAVVLSVFIALTKLVPHNFYTIISIFSVVFSLAAIIALAPLEHPNKPLSDIDRRRLRKVSLIYTAIICVLVVAFKLINYESIMVSIALGLLTASSSLIVAKMTGNCR